MIIALCFGVSEFGIQDTIPHKTIYALWENTETVEKSENNAKYLISLGEFSTAFPLIRNELLTEI